MVYRYFLMISFGKLVQEKDPNKQKLCILNFHFSFEFFVVHKKCIGTYNIVCYKSRAKYIIKPNKQRPQISRVLSTALYSVLIKKWKIRMYFLNEEMNYFLEIYRKLRATR